LSVSKTTSYRINGALYTDTTLAKEAAAKAFTNMLDRCVFSPKDRLAVFAYVLDNAQILHDSLQDLLQLYELLDEEN